MHFYLIIFMYNDGTKFLINHYKKINIENITKISENSTIFYSKLNFDEQKKKLEEYIGTEYVLFEINKMKKEIRSRNSIIFFEKFNNFEKTFEQFNQNKLKTEDVLVL